MWYMKQFKLLILLLVIGFVGEAQINYLPIKSRYKLIAGLFDSTLHIPSGTTPGLRTGGYDYRGALFYKTSDSTVYVYTGTQWISVKGSGGSGSADSTIFATLYRVDSAKTNIRTSLNAKIDSLRRVGLNVQAYKNGSWVTQYTDSLGSGGGSLSGSGTNLQVGLWDGTSSLTGRDYYTWADNGNYPQLKIGNGATTTYGASLGLRDVTGSYGYLSIDGGTLALYGSNTYKSVGIYDSSGGQQIARFYTGTGNRKYIDFTGETVYSGVVSPNATRGIVGVNRVFVYTPTGNSARAFSDETEFRIGEAAYGSFISNIRFGNNGAEQDHAIGAQSHWVKDSSNRMRKVYGFANSVSEMRAGAITDFYGYYHYSPTIYGGTIDNQYGIYIPAVTGATRNLAAYFGDSIQIQDGSQGVGKVLTSDANGLATWATPSGSAADSATFATNYRVDSAKTNLRTSINTKLNISDTANKWVTAVYRKTASDSVFYIKGGTHTFAYKDSTGGGGGTPSLTSTYVGFGDGSNLLTGSSRMTFNNDANYPTLTIDGTYEGYLYLSTAVAADNFRISGAGGGTLYGSDTYKSVAINDHIYGGQVARFYDAGGTKYTDINGLTSFTSTVAPNSFQGAAHIVRTIPYSLTGNNYNGYTDATDFRIGGASNVSFATFVQIGNNRTNQLDFTSFRSKPTKDSSNTVGKMYDFLADNWSMKAGTVDTAYRLKIRDINKTGGTLSVQYGIYVDSLSAASANYNFLGNRLGIGVKAPTEMLDVVGNGKFTGTLTTGNPGSGSGAWKLGTGITTSGLVLNTTTYVEITIGGTTYRLAVVDPPQP